LISLAQQRNDPELLGLAHLSLGVTLFYVAEYGKARRHLEAALASPACQPNYAAANVQSHTPTVASLAHLSAVLWSLGYPDQALARNDEGRAVATAVGHPPTVAYALFHAATVRQFRREWQPAKAFAEETIAYATQHHLPFWEAVARNTLSIVLIELGDASTGLAVASDSIAQLKAGGCAFAMPQMLCDLGRAHALNGEVGKGLQLVESAILIAERTGERWWEAELHRAKAEILLRASPPDAAATENSLRHAIALAEQQKAKSYALRAAIDLCHLLKTQGRSAEGLALLSPIYRWFTEGFATPDVVAAAVLLRDGGLLDRPA
jgi:predicted ATPase